MNSEKDDERADKGWTPDTAGGEEAITTEERSLDIGESGQFAPGGYYNQQGVNAPDRNPLEDDVVPPGRR